MIQAVDHVNIVVTDLERAIAFYCDQIGMVEQVRARLKEDWFETLLGIPGAEADAVILAFPEGGARLELLHFIEPIGAENQASPPFIPGLRHLAFRVDDIDAEVKRLKNQGVEFLSRPVDVPQGQVSFDTPVRKRLCYFRDPEGNILEFCSYQKITG